MSFNILFTGDLSATGIFSEKINRNIEIFDNELLNIFKQNDQIVCNFEGPSTSLPTILREDISIKSPKNTIDYLKQRNFSVFNLANNHVFDCDVEGFIETKDSIVRNKLSYFGAGENIDEASELLITEENGVKVAMIGVSLNDGFLATKNSAGILCINKLSYIKNKIAEIRKKVDWVILNYHGGEEFTYYPSPRKRKLLKKLLDNKNIDLVIAHHSHVFQGFEQYKSKLVFYSLGNFIFDITEHFDKNKTNKSAILRIEFNKNNYEFEFIPIIINTEKGIIKKANYDFKKHTDRLSDFQNYRIKWIKEAYLTFFKIPTIKGSFIGHDEQTFRNKNVLETIFKRKAYISFYKILISENQRQILLGALLYRLLLFFRLNKWVDRKV